MEKPDVDSIEGLSPAISIDQKTTSRNPRSTVGTVTEIYDYLRLLWARIGVPALPPLRRRDHRPDPGADRRPPDDPRGGDEIHGHGAGRARAQRRVREVARADAAGGLLAGQGQRRAAPPRRGDRPRQEVQTRRLGRRRPPGDEDRPAPPPLRVGRGRRGAGRRPGRSRDGRRLRGDDALQRAVRLPRVRHLDPRAGAADLLLQLAPRRLRALPRARLPAGDRPRAGRPRPDPLAGRGRAAALEPWRHRLLAAADRGRRRRLRGRRRQALVEAEEIRERDLPLRHRRRAPPGHLHQPLRSPPLLQGPLRGDRQPAAAALRGDRLGDQPRADRGLHGRAALPAVRGRAAAAGEPRGQGRRDQHRRLHRALGAGGRRVDRGAGADRDRAGDRAADRARDLRTARLPRERRHRLPLAGPLGALALRRRGAADPPGDPDRLQPGRRDVRARRALDRPAPARQREADRHARPPARPRQHGDRGRARRGHDAGRRPPGRPRPRRRRTRWPRDRRRHAGRGRQGPGLADWSVPLRQAPDRGAGRAPRAARARCSSAAPANTT